MKPTFVVLLFLASASAYAGDAIALKVECEKAIAKAEVLAAHHKWWPERPDPKAPVLNIRTHANFAKNVLLPLGGVFSHEKVGELTFEDQNGECLVESQGHPADVVLDDLAKKFSTSHTDMKSKASELCDSDNPLFSVDCHGNIKQQRSKVTGRPLGLPFHCNQYVRGVGTRTQP